ncbi:AAA family ATPase [Natronoflexus pectinivorans]|uniref:ATPase AAA-type core domain-containing protein n=1 Tax=Natronoflexus pectinivorans TaxID=682526 RepID=A0A4R2GI94_9BACT|nr:ATP-binding protein [Natronoflexus pectinivorans]TCO07004.1 hypothetical protein EV194_1102 [Natronoflexus pectinivorans]
MILNIELKNYRSFKNGKTFSLVAESSKSKEQNVFVKPLAKGEDEVRLLKTAMLFGANASGKSNLLRAMFEITKFIGELKPKAGEAISIYDPFKFATETKDSPVDFKIEFAGKDDIKYTYQIVFDRKSVLTEILNYYPNKKEANLFTRVIPDTNNSLTHFGKFGASLKSGKDIEVFHNQAILSKFGEEIPHEIITPVYIFLTKIDIINAGNSRQIIQLFNEMRIKIANDSNLLTKMNELLGFADTGLNSINIKELSEDKFNFPTDIPNTIKAQFIKDNKHFMTGHHSLFEESKLIRNDEPLPFQEESKGTNTIFALGGRIIQALESGEILFIDEIDTNLHPYLSKLLVCLFQSERINKHNSQLIFTSHNPILLDRTLFRKDQVWFTDKDEYGISDLYSLQDFPDVREDTPFDKWYLAGKFGGIPNIKSLESLFIDGQIDKANNSDNL